MQEGDVKHFQTVDDGEIISEAGIIEMTGGFETAAYLSLFGGNEDDDGRENNKKTWWGNLDETKKENKYISETQHLLQSIPATSSNLLKIHDAVLRDLVWFKDTGIASLVTAIVTIPALNKIKIVCNIQAIGDEQTFEFVENWRVAA